MKPKFTASTSFLDQYSLDDVNFEDDLGRAIQEEIDNGIIIEILKESGWIEVEISRFVDNDHAIDIQEWLKENATGNYKQWQTTFIFENEKDASWFTLKWL